MNKWMKRNVGYCWVSYNALLQMPQKKAFLGVCTEMCNLTSGCINPSDIIGWFMHVRCRVQAVIVYFPCELRFQEMHALLALGAAQEPSKPVLECYEEHLVGLHLRSVK